MKIRVEQMAQIPKSRLPADPTHRGRFSNDKIMCLMIIRVNSKINDVSTSLMFAIFFSHSETIVPLV